MIVGVLTTCHTQCTWDKSICFVLFNRRALQVFVTYLTGALYVHPLWFYKHQHDNRVRSKLFVACQWWRFQWRFWFVPSVPGYLREEEEHKTGPWRNPIERNHMGLHLENEVFRTPTIISNNPVYFKLTLILLTWRIWWAPNNASKWQMGFNSAFKGLISWTETILHLTTYILEVTTGCIIDQDIMNKHV